MENMEQYLQLKADGWYGANNYHILLVLQDEQPIAGSITDYLAEANTGVIEFLLVAPAFRGMGIAKQLLDFTEATLSADAKGNLNRDLDLIVGEMNDPFKIAIEDDNVDPFVRAKIWGKWGYQKLDFPYIQPALSTDQAPVYHLLLMGKVFNADFVKSTPTSLIKLIVHEYMKWAMRIENPDQNSEYQAMSRYLDSVEKVSITPLAIYVGHDVTRPLLVQEIAVIDDPDLDEILHVYKNSFSDSPVTAYTDDFINTLSKASSKTAGFNYHLWGLRSEPDRAIEGMASFFTFENAGFGGYVTLTGALKGNGRLRLLLARIEEQMLKDVKNCHGWFIECEPKGQELIFDHLGFHEIAVTYRQPPMSGQPLYDLEDAPDLRIMYKEFGCQYSEPKLRCEAFMNAIDWIFRTVYFIESPKDSVFFQDVQKQVLNFQDGFLSYRKSNQEAIR
jgi:GNAT superfamily N-acetyltransferase